jgi:hypothetical protein
MKHPPIIVTLLSFWNETSSNHCNVIVAPEVRRPCSYHCNVIVAPEVRRPCSSSTSSASCERPKRPCSWRSVCSRDKDRESIYNKIKKWLRFIPQQSYKLLVKRHQLFLFLTHCFTLQLRFKLVYFRKGFRSVNSVCQDRQFSSECRVVLKSVSTNWKTLLQTEE